jgi:uncharacterized protein
MISAQLKGLYELQTIDLELARTQKARASLDDGAAKKQDVEAARAAAEKADKLLHEAQTEMNDKDLNLKSVEAKRKTFKDKLYAGTVTNPKELSSMEKEIEMLGKQQGKLEERVLELMDLIEELKSAAAEAKSALQKQEKELVAHMDDIRQQEASLAARISELAAQREAAAEATNPVIRKKYEATRAHLGGRVVSKIEDAGCSACHTKIPGGLMRDIKSDLEIQTCDNCGRMLYLEIS